MYSYNLVTPVDKHRSRYFWFQLRNFKPNCQATTDSLNQAIESVFKEDLVVLAAVGKDMRDSTTGNIDISVGAGGAKFRRLIDQRIEVELDS